MNKILTTCCLLTLLGVATTIHAEKADRQKLVDVIGAKLTLDQKDNTSVMEGDVVLTQGTLRIEAARMRIKKDADDNAFAEIFSAAGKQITFREKREGFNDFIEGVADRAEFDQRANTVKFFNNARVKSGGDILTGDYMVYNTLTERFEAAGNAPNAAKPATSGEGSRVRLTFQPRQETTKPAAPAPGAAPASDQTGKK
jgi:lipopolysaccharide export system protein LptA